MKVRKGTLIGLTVLPFFLFCYYIIFLLPRLGGFSNDHKYFGDLLSEMGNGEEGLRAASCDQATACLAVLNPTDGCEWSRKCDQAMYVLADSIHQLGGSSCVRDVVSVVPGAGIDLSQCGTAKHIIVVGFQILKMHYTSSAKPIVPPGVILYNLGPLIPKDEDGGDYQWLVTRPNQVWDPNVLNIEQLKRWGVQAVHVPVGYAPGLTYVEPPQKKRRRYRTDEHGKKVRVPESPPEPDIDVLLLGPCSDRHSFIVNSLNGEQVTVRVSTSLDSASSSVSKELLLPPAHGIAAIQLLKRAKIILVVNDQNGDTARMDRISYFAANSNFVISESSVDPREEHLFTGGIVFAPYDGLVLACLQYLAEGSSARKVVSDKGLQLVSKLDLSSVIRCPLLASEHVFDTGISNAYTSGPVLPVLASQFQTSSSQLESFMKEFSPPPCFRVVALMAGNNEGESLFSSISDLVLQGVEVHFIDNWSTDNTAVIIKRLQREYPHKITTEKIPKKSSDKLGWAALVARKEALATELAADWIIDVRADELLESPWGAKVSLRTALYAADQQDYNLVSFQVLTFHSPAKTHQADSAGRPLKRNSLLNFSMFKADKKYPNEVKAWKTVSHSCYAKGNPTPLRPTPILSNPTFLNLDDHTFRFNNAPGHFFPGHHISPFTFFLRWLPEISPHRVERRDSISTSPEPEWTEVERARMQERLGLGVSGTMLQVLDNGDLPARLLSSYLPCRAPASHIFEI